jgi:FKBP-type peptidyl-prolyl cis-trans isomerase FklB
MRPHALAALLCLSALGGLTQAAETAPLADEADRIGYSLGYQIGGDFKRQGIALDAAALAQGIADAASGGEPLLDQAEMQHGLAELKRDITTTTRADAQQRLERRRQEAARKRSEGQAFMEQNAKQPGVQTLPSGLQYKVIRPGTGKTPDAADTVTVNYRARRLDGTEFDSTYRKRQVSRFRVDSLVAGWAEGLQLMREGAKFELYIPPDLAYSERGPLADQTLIFEVELLAVTPAGETAAQKPQPGAVVR